ncbi:MAG: hypothetical protein JWQ49_1278, partial [Edaphobacter sp.]|nr:hypothetical protein [Edaphobacter sp.]
RNLLIVVSLALSSGEALADINIPVNNPTFEYTSGPFFRPCGGVGLCGIGTGPILGWVNSGASGIVDYVNGTYFNAPDDYPDSAWSNGPSISQTVRATVQLGVTYTLQVDLGWSNLTAFDGVAGLLVNGTFYPATGNPVPGGWSPFVAIYTALPSDVGSPITIELRSSGEQGNFDNVRLAETPEPAYFGVGLASIAVGAVVLRRRRRSSRQAGV